jgi:carboxymethylenebutenolidase
MMNKVLGLLLLVCVLLPKEGWSQSCCAKPNNMQALALNKDFKAAHADPEPYTLAAQRGVMISFPADSAKGRAYYIPATGPSNKVLLVFHEWWGLNDYIKEMADKLNEDLANVHVYAIDLYDGRIATTADNAAKMMNGLSQKRVNQLLRGIVNYVGPDKRIATLGWCMGGTYSFQATLKCRRQAAGCVMYYGFPDKNTKTRSMLQTDVLYIRGKKDKFISEEDVSNFGELVKQSKHQFILSSFDADHAFANPSNPNHEPAATQMAYDKAKAFLISHFTVGN